MLIECVGTQGVEIHMAEIDDRRVFFIDTPGFDDTYRSDVDILRELADWLNRAYIANIKFSGIVYLQRISDSRMGGTGMKNLRMLKKLCGEDSLPRVVLATTWWDVVAMETAVLREKELMESKDFWADLLRQGSKVFRQDNSADSALNIIRWILSQPPGHMTLLIQDEMATGMPLNHTAAGRELQAEMERLRAKYEQEMGMLREEFKIVQRENDIRMGKEIKTIMSDLEKKMKQEREDNERLAITIGQLSDQRYRELCQLDLDYMRQATEVIEERHRLEGELKAAERYKLKREPSSDCSIM